MNLAIEAVVGIALLSEKNDWMQAQWNGLTREKQEAYRAAYDAGQSTSTTSETVNLLGF